MTTIIRRTLPLAMLAVFTACGNGENNKATAEDPKGAAADTQPGVPQTQGVPVAVKDDGLNAVYQHYLHLSTALTAGNAAEAKVASNAIEAGAREMDGGAAIAASAARITAASDIEAQRMAFSKMSNDLITLVKKAGVSNGELYVEYCPMAFDDKGASWLSSSKEIRNPYFGDKMLTCGEVKETIK